jgi:hypothetical protein
MDTSFKDDVTVSILLGGFLHGNEHTLSVLGYAYPCHCSVNICKVKKIVPSRTEKCLNIKQQCAKQSGPIDPV